MLRQVNRRINHFMEDNKIYKHFVFNKAEHRDTLRSHLSTLSAFLVENQPESSRKTQFLNEMTLEYGGSDYTTLTGR